jgi:hypothetical protein
VTLSAIFFVQIAEDESEAHRLTAAIATRYGLTPREARTSAHARRDAAATARAARRAHRALDLGYVVLNFRAAAELGRFAAEVLPALR